jgi:hypothetical protein
MDINEDYLVKIQNEFSVIMNFWCKECHVKILSDVPFKYTFENPAVNKKTRYSLKDINSGYKQEYANLKELTSSPNIEKIKLLNNFFLSKDIISFNKTNLILLKKVKPEHLVETEFNPNFFNDFMNVTNELVNTFKNNHIYIDNTKSVLKYNIYNGCVSLYTKNIDGIRFTIYENKISFAICGISYSFVPFENTIPSPEHAINIMQIFKYLYNTGGIQNLFKELTAKLEFLKLQLV